MSSLHRSNPLSPKCQAFFSSSKSQYGQSYFHTQCCSTCWGKKKIKKGSLLLSRLQECQHNLKQTNEQKAIAHSCSEQKSGNFAPMLFVAENKMCMKPSVTKDLRKNNKHKTASPRQYWANSIEKEVRPGLPSWQAPDKAELCPSSASHGAGHEPHQREPLPWWRATPEQRCSLPTSCCIWVHFSSNF